MEISSLEVDQKSRELVVDLFFEQGAVGESMALSVHQHVKVNRSSGVNKSERVYRKAFKVRYAGPVTRRIPLRSIEAYTYQGHDISMSTEVQITKAESLLGFLSTKKRPVKLGFFRAPPSVASAKVTIQPPDTFNLFKNVRVLSSSNQLYFLSVCLLAVLVIGANTIVGWHDQSAAVSSTYFYSHYNSDGERQSPLLNAMGVNLALLSGFGFWIKNVLRRYMTFQLVGKLGDVFLGKRYSLRRLLRGKSRVALQGCELRVVACNIEFGQYVTGSGKKRRTVSFKTPVKCVSIYKKALDHIPKEKQIASYLKDDICFDQVYDQLAPNCMVSKAHGLKLHWEVQLLHPELVDQEVVGASDGFHFGHFALHE